MAGWRGMRKQSYCARLEIKGALFEFHSSSASPWSSSATAISRQQRPTTTLTGYSRQTISRVQASMYSYMSNVPPCFACSFNRSTIVLTSLLKIGIKLCSTRREKQGLRKRRCSFHAGSATRRQQKQQHQLTIIVTLHTWSTFNGKNNNNNNNNH